MDAGIGELWHTGWMHNRVRMIVASFLVKDLLISWQEGAWCFWGKLVNADLANNTPVWQWTSGCGADAAPYFRVIKHVSQGEKFDPVGDHVGRWVHELSELPANYIQSPWEMSTEISSLPRNAVQNNRMPLVDVKKARLLELISKPQQ